MKSKMSRNFTLSRRFETFLVLFLYRAKRGTKTTPKKSRIFEIKSNLRHFTFIPTYTYRRCIDSFMPQYYFSVKLIAKIRLVKIRQNKI